MVKYTKESLELLREKIDLVELLSSHMQLKRSGATYKGCCPFHEEKTPSFIVRVGDSHYHCFGCGAHGDAIAFLMGYQKLPFSDAVEQLAERFGVTLQAAERGSDEGPSKAKMREVCEIAADFYHYYLLHSEEGRSGLEYLYKRGLDLSFIHLFRIGLAPSLPHLFQRAMREKQIDPKLLEIVGLTKGGRDFFFDRILFPITDAMDHVIGFSGRKVREVAGGPKYVNTPETPLFKKSKVLFGLSHSRKRMAKEKRAIIVEGQIDALRLIEAGFNLTVAGQGTAFGIDHAKEVIALGVQTVYLALDGDSAGREAALKIGNIFQSEGIEVLVIKLTEESDPDIFLRDEGPTAFQKKLDEAEDYLRFLVNYHTKEKEISSPAQKNQLVMMLSEQIRKWEHPLMVHESLRKLAQLTQVPETIINHNIAETPEIYIKKSGSISQQMIDPDKILESDLLRWLLLVGTELMPIAKANLREEHFQNRLCRELFRVIMEAERRSEPCDILALASRIESVEEQLFLSELLQKRINTERAKEGMVETVKKILVRNWMSRRETIRLRIQSGPLPDEELMKLAREFDELKGAPPEVVIPHA